MSDKRLGEDRGSAAYAAFIGANTGPYYDGAATTCSSTGGFSFSFGPLERPAVFAANTQLKTRTNVAMTALVVLFIASIWAGVQNALAGGGSFITLP
jgi:hypothetical protein